MINDKLLAVHDYSESGPKQTYQQTKTDGFHIPEQLPFRKSHLS